MSFTEWIADSHDEGQRLHSGALRSSGSQAARRQLWRRNTFGSGWKHTRAWFHVFISDRAALEASDWPGMDCIGGTTSDPNHVGTEQENGVRRGDFNSGPRVYTVRGECVLQLGALEYRPGCRNSPTLDYSTEKKKTPLGRVVRRCQRF